MLQILDLPETEIKDDIQCYGLDLPKTEMKRYPMLQIGPIGN